jgi:hypothetical protein
MAMRLPEDFREFLRLLKSHGVEYLLIGGYAVGYHGYPRATLDLDIWVNRSPDNARRVIKAIKDFGFSGEELTVDLFLKEKSLIRMGSPPMRIELATSISGVEFGECYQDRTVGDIDGMEASVISLRHLRINKRASGRHKDINDLEHLP